MLHFILEAEIKEARVQIKRAENDGEMKRRYPVLAGTTRQSGRNRREMKVVRCVTTFSQLHSFWPEWPVAMETTQTVCVCAKIHFTLWFLLVSKLSSLKVAPITDEIARWEKKMYTSARRHFHKYELLTSSRDSSYATDAMRPLLRRVQPFNKQRVSVDQPLYRVAA